MKDRFFESSLHVVMIAITARLVLDQQVFYFTQPDTTPTKLVQDIIGRLNNAPIKNEVPTEKATLNTEPGSDNSTQRKVDTEESVHPMDKLSDCATYHLIPLFKPEEAELRPSSRTVCYESRTSPKWLYTTGKNELPFHTTTKHVLPNGEKMVKLLLYMGLSDRTHKEFQTGRNHRIILHKQRLRLTVQYPRTAKCPSDT